MQVHQQDSPLLSFFAKTLPPHGRVHPSNSRPAARKEGGATTRTPGLLCLLHVWVSICTNNMICLDIFTMYRSSWALSTSSHIRAAAALVGVRGGCFRSVVALNCVEVSTGASRHLAAGDRRCQSCAGAGSTIVSTSTSVCGGQSTSWCAVACVG